jgi:multidrug efflux pump subunit AcrA (membrane-fusion protein)
MNGARLIALALLSSSCVTEPAPPETTERPRIAAAASRWVEVQQPTDVSILEAPAIARASANAVGEVTPPAAIRIARIHVQVGQAVAAGDPIVDAYAPEVLDAAAVYLSAGVRARVYEIRANQLEALIGEGLVRRAQVFEQRARAADHRAERQRAIALLRSSGVDPKDAKAILDRGVMTLVSPSNGVVTELSARVGRSYQPGTGSIAQVLGEADARIEVRTAQAWPAASAVVFQTSDGREIALEPTPVATAVVPSDGTRRSWFEPKEATPLPDGLVGTAKVSAAEGLWEVPAASIRRKGEIAEVLRQRNGRSTVIDVDIAAASGASALVRGSLREGDRIASEFPVDGPPERSR